MRDRKLVLRVERLVQLHANDVYAERDAMTALMKWCFL